MNKYYSFLNKGYTLLGKNKVCKSDNGDFPLFCEGSVISLNSCKVKCTSQRTCVAINFSVGAWYKCYLLVSEYECPSGFTLNIRSREVTSTKDLVVRGGRKYHGASCYGKNSD